MNANAAVLLSQISKDNCSTEFLGDNLYSAFEERNAYQVFKLLLTNLKSNLRDLSFARQISKT